MPCSPFLRSLVGSGSALCALGSVWAPSAEAAVTFTARSSTAVIETTRSDFADARLTIDATTQVGAGSTGSRTIGFSASPELLSHISSSSGQVAVTETAFTPPSDITARVDATGPGGGSFTFLERFVAGDDPYGYGPLYRYATGANELPSDPFFPNFTNRTAPLLEVYLAIVGAGLVDENGRFTVAVSMPGDYSGTNGLDSGAGQHYLNSLGTEWAITQDFVYDRASNRTLFSAVNASYHYDPSGDHSLDPSPYLDVFFLGSAVAAVPEASSGSTLVLGLSVLVAAGHRRVRGGKRLSEASRSVR